MSAKSLVAKLVEELKRKNGFEGTLGTFAVQMMNHGLAKTKADVFNILDKAVEAKLVTQTWLPGNRFRLTAATS